MPPCSFRSSTPGIIDPFVLLRSDGNTFCDMHPHLMHRQVLRLFYSPEHRMHPNAKSSFVEPDLTAFPKIPPKNK